MTFVALISVLAGQGGGEGTAAINGVSRPMILVSIVQENMPVLSQLSDLTYRPLSSPQ